MESIRIDEEWLAEAQRRASELDEGTVQPVSAEEVRRKALTILATFGR